MDGRRIFRRSNLKNRSILWMSLKRKKSWIMSIILIVQMNMKRHCIVKWHCIENIFSLYCHCKCHFMSLYCHVSLAKCRLKNVTEWKNVCMKKKIITLLNNVPLMLWGVSQFMPDVSPFALVYFVTNFKLYKQTLIANNEMKKKLFFFIVKQQSSACMTYIVSRHFKVLQFAFVLYMSSFFPFLVD